MQHHFRNPTPFTTLREAREWVRLHRDDGAWCPCCDLLAKVYRRPLNSGMARALIEMHRLHSSGRTWIDLARILNPSITFNREWGRLEHWGLVESRDAPPTPGKAHYEYRLTHLGNAFVEGRSQIPRRVWLYGGELVGIDTEMIDILDALGDKFDYAELMGWSRHLRSITGGRP